MLTKYLEALVRNIATFSYCGHPYQILGDSNGQVACFYLFMDILNNYLEGVAHTVIRTKYVYLMA